MRLTRLAIEKNRITAVVMLLILAAGLQAYVGLPRDEDPGFLIRIALVTTYLPGASPDRIERLVTDRIETAVRQIPELKEVTSQSRAGVSLVFVELREEYFDLQPIWDDIRRKVEAVQPDLPEGSVGPFVNDEYGDVYGILISITGPGFTYRQLWEVAKQVRDELLFLPDAAKVEVYGAQEERIFLEYSDGRLAEYGLSPTQLRSILAAQNIVASGGAVATDLERMSLEPTGNFESVAELRETAIPLPGSGELVPLRDLVHVERGYVDPPETLRRASGEPALGIAVSMRDGGNLIELGEQVRSLLERLRPDYPLGIQLDISQFQPDVVQRKIDAFETNLVQAVAIVTAVMLLTLGFRTGVIVASLVPGAMVFAFAVMGWLGIQLDQMSLAALIIALGLLIDNAIVISESIMVQMAAGKPAVQAAVDSADELALALLTSSLTTAAAFLPMYLAENAAGEFTAPIFKVLATTLLCSWVLSLTLIPMLCVRFLKVRPQPEADAFESGFYRRYRGFLYAVLQHRGLTLASVVAVLALSIFSFRFLPSIFFPANDRPLMVADLQFPFGTAVEHTIRATEGIDAYIAEELQAGSERAEGITNWVTYLGEGGPRFTLGYTPEEPAPHTAAMLINATSRKAVVALAPRLEAWCNESFPGLKATVRPLISGPSSWPPIQVEIAGRDVDRLFAIVDEVKERLWSLEGTRLIDDNWGARAKKLVVQVDQARTRRAGLTSRDVAVSLEANLSGLDATQFRDEEELIPVTVRSRTRGHTELGDLESINVFPEGGGEPVPLGQIAAVRAVWEPGVIHRKDRLRTVTVEAAPKPGYTAAEINQQLEPWLAGISREWPHGYRWSLAGEYQDSAEAGGAIRAKLPMAGLAIVLLLVFQFNSIRKPAIILLTIPFGLIGVVFGLLVARSYFGFMTLLGIISLSGIVVNNAIVLIERIQLEIGEFNRTPQEAVIQAAQRRLRPILLTTATTVGGLLPLWLGGGPMFEPMAIAILFGLVFATVLTLGLVPILYSLFFGVRFVDTPPGR
jgi:multidrug efflux pump subunit AcrB